MTLRIVLVSSVVLLAACGRGDCAEDEQILAFADADGDGWGSAELGRVCALGAGESDREGDCNDEEPSIHPGAVEECNGVDDDCDAVYDDGLPGTRPFYQDADGDGHGNPEAAAVACLAPAGYSDDRADCDDGDAAVHPGAAEVCNAGIDDDCDGLSDDDDDSVDPETRTRWFRDDDGDGYGSPGTGMEQCAQPAGGVSNDLDCEDGVPDANPEGTEICNGIDDDCDGLLNELDDSLDPSLLIDAYADADGDGAGDPNVIVQVCQPKAGLGVANAEDCDDANADANPLENETLCDLIDNDCDEVTIDNPDRDLDGYNACDGDCNDLDDLINPGAFERPADATDSNCDGFEDCHQDVDGDGARSAGVVQVADPQCMNAPNVPPWTPLDCDDNDPQMSWSGQWVFDADGDGHGSDVIAVEQCADPGPGYSLLSDDADCDDADVTVFPGAPDPCNDGIDADCDGDDACASCAAWIASDPSLPSGVYTIQPDGANDRDVYCDHDTDGGGWTLVASTADSPPNDAAGAYHVGLTTLVPADPRPGVWAGLAGIAQTADVRFACKLDRADPSFAVDLSFYDVAWYADMVVGGDDASCFSEAGNPFAPPARRDNLTGATRPAGDPWDGGGLVGEDTCTDTDDFAVDFDDRGIDGDEADGTDWGEDDGKEKCTASTFGDAWFIFVRE